MYDDDHLSNHTVTGIATQVVSVSLLIVDRHKGLMKLCIEPESTRKLKSTWVVPMRLVPFT